MEYKSIAIIKVNIGNNKNNIDFIFKIVYAIVMEGLIS